MKPWQWALLGAAMLGFSVLAGDEPPPGPLIVPPPPGPPPPPPRKRSTSGGISSDTIARLDQYAALFDQAAKSSGVPGSVLRGLAAAESDGHADSGKGGKGYKGLLQCERDEGQLDPATSIPCGAAKWARFTKSLAKLLQPWADVLALSRWDQVRLVAAGYNAGPGTVEEAVKLAAAGGDWRRWAESQYYQPALYHTGAYSTGAYKPIGTSDADVADAERVRKALAGRHLTLDQITAEKPPPLVTLGVSRKADNTMGYTDKIIRYAQHFEAVA